MTSWNFRRVRNGCKAVRRRVALIQPRQHENARDQQRGDAEPDGLQNCVRCDLVQGRPRGGCLDWEAPMVDIKFNLKARVEACFHINFVVVALSACVAVAAADPGSTRRVSRMPLGNQANPNGGLCVPLDDQSRGSISPDATEPRQLGFKHSVVFRRSLANRGDLPRHCLDWGRHEPLSSASVISLIASS